VRSDFPSVAAARIDGFFRSNRNHQSRRQPGSSALAVRLLTSAIAAGVVLYDLAIADSDSPSATRCQRHQTRLSTGIMAICSTKRSLVPMGRRRSKASIFGVTQRSRLGFNSCRVSTLQSIVSAMSRRSVGVGQRNRLGRDGRIWLDFRESILPGILGHNRDGQNDRHIVAGFPR